MDGYRRVVARLEALGPFDMGVMKSQVVFRRRRGFAYRWLPRMWLHDAAPSVLSIALYHRAHSPRWKEVAHPAKGTFMHHLEVHGIEEIDDEVAAWLRDAYQGSG